MTKALYPGGFDPPTNGHLDIVDRASRLFDEVVVGIFGRSSELFTIAEREVLMKEATAQFDNVTVTSFEGLMVKYALDIDASVVVRGMRALTDFAAEFDMAMMNNKMAPEIDAAYFMTRSRHLYISASRIRELAALKQSVADLVPPNVLIALEEKFGPPETMLGVRAPGQRPDAD